MGALIVHDDVLEQIGEKIDKYEKLVWYARKASAGHSSWDAVPEDIKHGALNAVAQVEEHYPDEIDQLHGEHADWEHGFNSGMLAALRYVMHAASDVDEAEEMFPELDT